jgi:hypothetical protein
VNTPKIAVIKEKELIFQEADQSLEDFIKMEQFQTFTPISRNYFIKTKPVISNLFNL